MICVLEYILYDPKCDSTVQMIHHPNIGPYLWVLLVYNLIELK